MSNDRITWYAHSNNETDRQHWHPLSTHLQQVGNLAATLAMPFGGAAWAKIAGNLHDLGKASSAFQRRLNGGPRVDHATAGAKMAIARYPKPIADLLTYVILGHHSGLPDGAERMERLKKTDIPPFDDDAAPHPPAPDKPPPCISTPFSIPFFVRMLFSCLVDADHLDTERFMDPEKSAVRDSGPALPLLRERLTAHLNDLTRNAHQTPIQQQRTEILRQCRTAADLDPGFFSLTVPTGGGKTLSSLAFALDHALRHDKRRVIYVIPYTSIIEQNARVFRKAVGDEAVLEHHANFDPDREVEDGRGAEKIRLATDNWNRPLVVTTNVQFFESLFANRPSRCRKLHNIANSVIILDEAQMLPAPLLRPCLAALRALTDDHGVSVVLCSATQPALSKSKWLPRDGLDGVREIIDDPAVLYESLRRVRVEKCGPLDDSALNNRLAGHERVLAVVNTRNQAQQLYQGLTDLEGVFHLSARMCPAHRSEKLAEIRAVLERVDAPCRVISTQLIEAGVDIDFPVVYRALAGLDSIAQAAGRCNREGRLQQGIVHVFEAEGENPRGDRQRRATGARRALEKHTDPLGLEAVREFFQHLFEIENLDRPGILEILLHDPRALHFNFRQAAEAFRMIDSHMYDVIVPFNDEAASLINILRHTSHPAALLRSLQPYVTQLPENEFRVLKNGGAIESRDDRFHVLINGDLYDQNLGLLVEDPTYRDLDGCFV